MSGSKPLFAAGVAGGGLGTAAATAFDTLAAFLGGAGAGIRCVTGASPARRLAGVAMACDPVATFGAAAVAVVTLGRNCYRHGLQI